jgi:hypothetical protein
MEFTKSLKFKNLKTQHYKDVFIFGRSIYTPAFFMSESFRQKLNFSNKKVIFAIRVKT